LKLARESTNSAGISGVPGLTGATVAAGLLRRDHLLLACAAVTNVLLLAFATDVGNAGKIAAARAGGIPAGWS
jgi:hypothetical protein